jgi:hypothetical protein
MRCVEQHVEGGKELTMGDLTAELPPQHLNRVQPRAVRGQLQQAQPPCRGVDHGLDCIIELGVSMIPGHLDGPGGMVVDHGLQPFGDLLATFAASEQHDGFARIIIDGAQTRALVRLPWGGDHDVLTSRTSQGAQGGQPADMACVRIGKHLTGFQVVAGLCKRRFLSAYSGSGRLIWCWGRLSTTPACVKARRTVSSETRMLVLSARSSTKRCKVHREHGSPKLRGRRRTAVRHALR